MGTTFFIAPALTALAAVGSSGVAGGRWQPRCRWRPLAALAAISLYRPIMHCLQVELYLHPIPKHPWLKY
jgi:hypothetical protein